MSLEENRELYLEECAVESVSWNEEDQNNLNKFLATESGRKLLGKFQLMWKGILVTVPMAISCHDPHSAAAKLAFCQGEVRSVLRCIDRLFEMEPPDAKE